MSRCIVTGCGLYDHNYGAWAWGDLHEEGNVYIFNSAQPTGNWEMPWIHQPLDSDQRILQIRPGSRYFARRGVLVVAKMDTTHNPALREYLENSPHV